MKHRIVYAWDLLKAEDYELLEALVGAKQDQMQLHNLVAVETDDALLFEALKTFTRDWPLHYENTQHGDTVVRGRTESTEIGEEVLTTGVRSERNTKGRGDAVARAVRSVAPRERCPKCGQFKALVTSSGMCNDCHMLALLKSGQAVEAAVVMKDDLNHGDAENSEKILEKEGEDKSKQGGGEGKKIGRPRVVRTHNPGDGVETCAWCGRKVKLNPTNGMCSACQMEHSGGIDQAMQKRIDKIVEDAQGKDVHAAMLPATRLVAVRKF